MDVESYLLGKKAGGGGGTSDYSQLSNKPSINGVTLDGNKTSADLGINAGDNTFVLNKNGYYNLSEMKAGVYYFNDTSGKAYVRLNSNYNTYWEINFGVKPSYFKYFIVFRDNVNESSLTARAPLALEYIQANNGSISTYELDYSDSATSGISGSNLGSVWLDTFAGLRVCTGYNASKTQTLKNVNGTLTWVDD